MAFILKIYTIIENIQVIDGEEEGIIILDYFIISHIPDIAEDGSSRDSVFQLQ